MTTELVITLEGGLVSAVVSNNPEFFKDVNVTVVDYDTDGNTDSAVLVEQGSLNGDGQPNNTMAIVRDMSVEEATIPIPLIITEVEE